MTAAALKSGLFTQGPDPALLGGRCTICGRTHFPRTGICPYCSEEKVEEVELSRSGRLWAWTSVATAPPGYLGDVPYGFGVVELPEGVRIVTRLAVADPERLHLGHPMHLEIAAVRIGGQGDEPEEALTYAFAPSDRAERAAGADGAEA